VHFDLAEFGYTAVELLHKTEHTFIISLRRSNSVERGLSWLSSYFHLLKKTIRIRVSEDMQKAVWTLMSMEIRGLYYIVLFDE